MYIYIYIYTYFPRLGWRDNLQENTISSQRMIPAGRGSTWLNVRVLRSFQLLRRDNVFIYIYIFTWLQYIRSYRFRCVLYFKMFWADHDSIYQIHPNSYAWPHCCHIRDHHTTHLSWQNTCLPVERPHGHLFSWWNISCLFRFNV